MRAYLDPDIPDPGRTAADRVATDAAEQVEIGVYILQVRELSIHDSRWQVHFDIWFEWRGDRKSPFENLVLINGSLDSSHLHEQIDDGDLHYERYEIAATLTKEFHVAHFPLDEHLLVLAFENARLKRQDLLFVPDATGSEVSSQVSIPGYRIRGMECVESPRSYKTARGRPGVSPSVRDTFSQARFAVRIVRDGWGLYWKMFQALFVAVAISLLPLFVRPTNLDPRFGLGVGALVRGRGKRLRRRQLRTQHRLLRARRHRQPPRDHHDPDHPHRVGGVALGLRDIGRPRPRPEARPLFLLVHRDRLHRRQRPADRGSDDPQLTPGGTAAGQAEFQYGVESFVRPTFAAEWVRDQSYPASISGISK